MSAIFYLAHTYVKIFYSPILVYGIKMKQLICKIRVMLRFYSCLKDCPINVMNISVCVDVCCESCCASDSGPSNCSSHQWQCDSKQCVPAIWHCDGDTDCHDSSDERNCTKSGVEQHGNISGKHCSLTEFQCVANGECIHKAWQCDGDNDCLDSSDEVGCK